MRVPDVRNMEMQQVVQRIYDDIQKELQSSFSDKRSKLAERQGQIRPIENSGSGQEELSARFKRGWVKFPSVDMVSKMIEDRTDRIIERVITGTPVQRIGGTGSGSDFDPSTLSVNTSFPLAGGGSLNVPRTISLNYGLGLKMEANELRANILDPLYFDGLAIGVRDHGNAQTGVLNTGSQSIYGEKSFVNHVYALTGQFRHGGGVSRFEFRTPDNSALAPLRIGAPTGSLEAVRADRTLTMANAAGNVLTWSLSGAQNLTTNRTWTPTLRIATSTLSGIVSATAQSFGGVKTFEGGLRLPSSQLFQNTGTFADGFSGTGFRIGTVGNEWNMTLDNLLIRGSLQAYEFIIDRISAINGSDLLSPGRGKVESNPSQNVYVMTDPTGGNFSSFAVDDLVMVQQYSPNGTTIIKRIVRRVTSVSSNAITLATLNPLVSGGGGTPPADVGQIEVGDVIVAFGNTSNANRRGSIFRTAFGPNSPYGRINSDVRTWQDWTSGDKTVLQYGNLGGMTIGSQNLSGYGIMIKDRFYAQLGSGSGLMTMGRDAGGSGNHGIRINQGNFWYGTGSWRIGDNTPTLTRGIHYNHDDGRLRIKTLALEIDDSVNYDASNFKGQGRSIALSTITGSGTFARTMTMGNHGSFINHIIWSLGPGDRVTYPDTYIYSLGAIIRYQGSTNGLVWTTFHTHDVAENNLVYQDPRAGSEPDPAELQVITPIEKFVPIDGRFTMFRVQIEHNSNDEIQWQVISHNDLDDMTSIGDNGLLAVRTKSIIASRIYISENEYVEIVTRRETVGSSGMKMYAQFFSNGNFISETQIASS